MTDVTMRKLLLVMLGFVLTISLTVLAVPAVVVQAESYSPMISAGSLFTVGLKFDGTVIATGNNAVGECNVSSWADITQVSTGYQHTVGLKSDGTVVATGNNDYGECDVSSWTGIIQVSAGNHCTVGLKSDGTVVTTGRNDYGQSNVSSWTGITQVSEYFQTVGLKSDGTVVAVGPNGAAECNVGSWTGITQVSAGESHTVGLKSDGTVVATGMNDYGQCNVSSWTGITQVSAGSLFTVGLKSDGTVVAVGDNRGGGSNVSSWTGITQISIGGGHTVGLKSDGTVVAVGENVDGECNVSSWNLKVSTTTPISTTLKKSFTEWFPYVDNSPAISPNLMESTLVVCALQDETHAYIDLNYNDLFDSNEPDVTLKAGQETSFANLPIGQVIKLVSDGPIDAYYRYNSQDFGSYDDSNFAYSACPLGTRFVVPFGKFLVIGATQNSTRVSIGGKSIVLNTGQIYQDLAVPGLIISADKQIAAMVYCNDKDTQDNSYATELFPNSKFGTEFWVPTQVPSNYQNVQSNNQKLYVVYADGKVDVSSLPLSKTNKIVTDQPATAYSLFDIYAKDPWVGSMRHFTNAYSIPSVQSLGTEYVVAGSIISTHDDNKIEIDSNYDEAFEKSVILSAGQEYNPFVISSDSSGLVTQNIGHIRSTYPVLVRFIQIGNWGGISEMTWARIAAPITTTPTSPPTENSIQGSVSTPQNLPKDAKTIATESILAIVTVLIFYFSATLFNSTIKENYKTFQNWSSNISKRLTFLHISSTALPNRLNLNKTKLRLYLEGILVVVICTLIYWFLDPYFAEKLKGIILFISLAIGIAIATFGYDGIQVLISRRSFKVPSIIGMYPLAIPIAIICVLVSRAINFHPGLIYGFVGSYIALTISTELTDKRNAILVLCGTGVVFVICVLAFFARGPLQNHAVGSWQNIVDSILAATVAIGLEGLVFLFVPLTFLDGHKVIRWNFWIWLSTAFLLTFLFWWIIIIQNRDLKLAAIQMGAVSMYVLMGLSLTISFGIWLFFKRHHKVSIGDKDQTPASPEKGEASFPTEATSQPSPENVDVLEGTETANPPPVEIGDTPGGTVEKEPLPVNDEGQTPISSDKGEASPAGEATTQPPPENAGTQESTEITNSQPIEVADTTGDRLEQERLAQQAKQSPESEQKNGSG